MSMILAITSVLLLVLPLITAKFYGLTREGSRYAVFVCAAWISGLMTLKCLVFDHKRRGLVFTTSDSLILLYLCIVLIADAVGLDFTTSILGSAWRHQGYIFLLCCVIFWSSISYLHISVKNFFTKAETIIVCSHITVLGWAFVDTVKRIIGLHVELYNNRVANPIGNPNSLAGYLLMTLPFVMLYKRIPVVAKIILFLLNVSVILGTESRSGLLTLVVTLAILGFQYKKKMLLLSFIPLLMLLLFYLSSGNYLSRYSVWDNQLIIWNAGIKALINKPILGYGQENFELIFPEDRLMKVDNAHNIFIEIAVSSGLLGLSIFVSILIYTLKDAPLVVKVGLIAFLITAQFNPLSIVELVYFWFYLGLSSKKIKSDYH